MRFTINDLVFRLEFGYARGAAVEGTRGPILTVSAYLWQLKPNGKPIMYRSSFVDLTGFKGRISKEASRLSALRSLAGQCSTAIRRAIWVSYVTRRDGTTKHLCPHCQKDVREQPKRDGFCADG